MRQLGPNGGRDAQRTHPLENGVTFPNVLDSSDVANRAARQYETLEGMSAVPFAYLINRPGKVVDAWYGFAQSCTEKALKALGL